MKDVTGRIVKSRKRFWVDKEDIDTGEEIVSPGNEVCFVLNGKKFKAAVTSKVCGRDNDMYQLEVK